MSVRVRTFIRLGRAGIEQSTQRKRTRWVNIAAKAASEA